MNITIIGVPYNLDQPCQGMGMAPQALLNADIATRLTAAGGTVIATELVEPTLSGATREERIGDIMGALGAVVARARNAGTLPLVLGGDCLTALGTLAGLGNPAHTGIAWFDAHGDFNTPETTLSGYLGGMPLACAVGRGLVAVRERCGLATPVQEANVALFDARDLDAPEEQALRNSAVTLLRTTELQDQSQLEAVLAHLGMLDQVYLHIDIDVLDLAVVPGVDFPTPGGLNLDALQPILARVAGLTNLAAIGLTAVNPEKDIDGRTVASALAVATRVTEAAAHR